MPSLRKALKDVAMEKDAAVVARVHTIFSLLLQLFVIGHCFFFVLHQQTLTFSVGGSLSPTSNHQETFKGS